MKEIKLTRGLVAVIDDEDFELVSSYKWHAIPSRKTHYAASTVNNKLRIFLKMHRLILKLIDSKQHVDHIDGNGLNNQKNNLRICSNSENSKNRTKYANNTSGFKGVHWSKFHKKWRAMIFIDNKNKHLGFFQNTNDAALAYNEAAIKYYGEFANLNKIE